MKLSSKSLTAIKLFVDLGEHYNQDCVSLMDVANRKEVSKKFLEQIVILYKQAGLIIGNRGNQGGYKLAKPPYLITLKDILEVSESAIFEPQNDGNLIKGILKELDNKIDEYFSSITLSSLVDKQIESYTNNYII